MSERQHIGTIEANYEGFSGDVSAVYEVYVLPDETIRVLSDDHRYTSRLFVGDFPSMDRFYSMLRYNLRATIISDTTNQ